MNNANFWRAVPLAHIAIATALIAFGLPPKGGAPEQYAVAGITQHLNQAR